MTIGRVHLWTNGLLDICPSDQRPGPEQRLKVEARFMQLVECACTMTYRTRVISIGCMLTISLISLANRQSSTAANCNGYVYLIALNGIVCSGRKIPSENVIIGHMLPYQNWSLRCGLFTSVCKGYPHVDVTVFGVNLFGYAIRGEGRSDSVTDTCVLA